MVAPISSMNSQMSQAPVAIGASRLSEKQLHLEEKKGYVANPPSNFYKYSIYEDLDLGKDRFKELLGSLKKESPEMKHRKTKKFLKRLVNLAVVVAGGFIAYKHRVGLKNFFVNGYNKMKTWLTNK